jgi:hypothetical protein
MDEATIKKIVEEVSHYFPDYRVTLAIQALITLIVATVGTYFGSYLKEPGKNLATKADFDTLQRQLGEQTKLVETIRSDVSQKDWATREWTNIRRVKLEELMVKVAECDGYLERLRNASIAAQSLEEHRDFGTELQAHCALYFPELESAVAGYLVTFREIAVSSIALRVNLLKLKEHATDRQKEFTSYGNAYAVSYAKILRDRASIERVARQLMVKIMGVEV